MKTTEKCPYKLQLVRTVRIIMSTHKIKPTIFLYIICRKNSTDKKDIEI